MLLSSSEHQRFDNDILRNLSAPVGAQVTFRYESDIVENSTLNGEPISKGDMGLVCHANMPEDGRGALVPVRFVYVKEVFRPGSTLVLELKMRGFADYNGKSFDELALRNDEWREKYPNKEDGRLSGNFVFSIENDEIVSETTDITKWESRTEDLHENGSLSQVYYFLVAGIFKGNIQNINRVNKWDKEVDIDKNYEVPVYIFSPESSRGDLPGNPLHISSSVGIDSKSPIDLAMNAPYDLKKWSIRIPSQNMLGTGYEWIGQREGWLQIGPKESEAGNTGPFRWQIDLDLTYGRSSKDFFKAAALLTPVYGITFFLGLSSPEDFSVLADLITAAAFGFVVAVVTLFLANVSR